MIVADGREQWTEVQNRIKYILKEIDPRSLLSILERGRLFQQTDSDNIKAISENNGLWHGAGQLLERLKRRGPHSFPTFVAALREAGLDHAAQLLDPKCQVSVEISKGRIDDRVFEAGVVADIRVKICLTEQIIEKQVMEVKEFCEIFNLSYTADAVTLRHHFSDLVDEKMRPFVNLVKTTSSEEHPLIFVFRLSNIHAAEMFWESFNNGELTSIIKTKLRSLENKNNCFENGDIEFDVVVDEEDFHKVVNTLKDPKQRKVLVDGMEKQPLELRNYQLDLVKPALEGKNTIICAPTGSGKTFVAMKAIEHHAKREDMKYVAFIVSTVSLVEQQKSCLERYLPESVEVSSHCGSNPDVSLRDILEDSNVVVLTAQILVNALMKKNEGMTDKKEISISQFSLLVFDECHHTTKDHPYNHIMRWYMKEKKSSESPNLPQIIGLSASLGIGTGNDGNGTKAKEHVMKLCANLDIHELQVYREPLNTRTELTSISRDHNNMFHTTITGVMNQIETMMSSSTSSVDKPSYTRGSQPYENWVVNLKKNDLGSDMLTCAEHLDFYNNSLMINDEIRCEDALKYLQDNIKSRRSTEIELTLGDIFDKAVSTIKEDLKSSETSPRLQKLEELLLKKFQSGSEQSKGIIFVRTRFVAECLVDWLANSNVLEEFVNNPTWLVGCSGGQYNGRGMTKTRQEQEIRNFRDGDCNVIVATSALLEGIDIPKCNFVINYGMPGNEITHVQARGRVRTKDIGDTYDVIVPRELQLVKARDLAKEKLMNDTVHAVKEMPKEKFNEEVNRIQEKAYNEYLKELASQKSKTKLASDGVDLYCKCGVFACKATHIRKFHSAYLVPRYEKYLHNATFTDKDAGKSAFPGKLTKTGKTLCCKCNREWGNRARNEHGEFPLLKISNFRVWSGSAESQVYNQWKDFPYEVKEFDVNTDVNVHCCL